MSKKRVISSIISIIFILAVVFLDSNGKVLDKFDKNYERSFYFENCEKDSSATSTAFFDVVDTSDGDTIIISKDCKPVIVRLIGIDTPETVDPRKPVQCFGKEASEYTKNNLKGKKVQIETDDMQDTYDKYGRLLGYVILEDGTNFNQRLIEEGYAHEYTYKTPYKYQKEFKEAQANAKETGKGLWGVGVCEK
jgi:endonuclease YncB( thermonuclease family)